MTYQIKCLLESKNIASFSQANKVISLNNSLNDIPLCERHKAIKEYLNEKSSQKGLVQTKSRVVYRRNLREQKHENAT
jgi:hypothetical protein